MNFKNRSKDLKKFFAFSAILSRTLFAVNKYNIFYISRNWAKFNVKIYIMEFPIMNLVLGIALGTVTVNLC